MDKAQLLLLAKVRRLAASGDARRIREEAGLSCQEVASALGVRRSTIVRWESADRTPRATPAAIAWVQLLDELRAASSPVPSDA